MLAVASSVDDRLSINTSDRDCDDQDSNASFAGTCKYSYADAPVEAHFGTLDSPAVEFCCF